MKILVCALLLITASVRAQDSAHGPDVAFANGSTDPNPGSGRFQIIAGWISLGVSAAGFAQVPLCRLNDYEGDWTAQRCRRTGWVVGSLGLALAVPWLVFGYRKHHAQKLWKARNGLDVAFTGDTITASFRF